MNIGNGFQMYVAINFRGEKVTMNVVFPNITHEQVKEKRSEILKSYVNFDYVDELIIHYFLKRAPFFVGYLSFVCLNFNKYSQPVYMNIYSFFEKIIDGSSIHGYICMFFLPIVMTCSFFGIVFILGFRLIFFASRKCLPRKTPVMDKAAKYRKFWRDSDVIEDILAFMNEIKKLNLEDIGRSELILEKKSNEIIVFLKDSTCGITTKQKYTIKHPEMMKKLRENGILDFSFIEQEWSTLLQKYQLE